MRCGRPDARVGSAMLSYYLHDGPSAIRFKLCGALGDSDAAELNQCWRTASSTIGSRTLLIDISELTAADDAGRTLLGHWHQNGAQFVANSTASRSIAESIG